jgi:hypothetical protein
MIRSSSTALNDDLRAFVDLAQGFARKELMGHREEYEYPG